MHGPALTILTALWVQGALALALLGLLGFERVPRIMRKQIPVADVALSREAWPDSARKVANAVDNQFQLPLLMFAGAAFALWAGPTWLEAGLVVLFVLSRIVHAAIHVTSNHVYRRFFAYLVGYVLMLLFWAVLAVRLALAAMGA